MEKVYVKSIIENCGLFYVSDGQETVFSNGIDILGGKFSSKKLDGKKQLNVPNNVSDRDPSTLFALLGVDYSE